MGEHATPTHGGELGRVTDADQAPVTAIGQIDQPGQVLGRRHAGLVEDDRSPRPELPLGRRAFRSAVLVEQLGQGGGRRGGLTTEHVGGLARGSQADHGSALLT